MPDLLRLPVHELSRRMSTGQLSPVELMQLCVERTRELNGKLHGFISVQQEARLLEEAREAEKEIKLGRIRSPLHGIPVGVKDGIAVKGIPNTAGSKILRDFVPDHDATVIRNLRKSGAIIFGKTNLHEFAWGATTANPHFGTARNPFDQSRMPGGSSGGSGVVVASSMVPVALGEDTGGSIRIPSSFCGLFGIRPTLGRVSRFGVVPLGYSFDTVGPMARDPLDAGLLLEAICGRDEKDPETYNAPSSKGFTSTVKENVEGLRVGVPEEYFAEGLVDDEVESNYRRSIAILEKNGATTQEIAIPFRRYLQGVWYAITFTESSSFHEPWAKSRLVDYGDDVRAHRSWIRGIGNALCEGTAN